MNNQSEDRVLGYVGTYPVGDYNEQTEYEYLNVVTHRGSSYVCIKEEGCIAVEPPNEECWQLFAGKGDTGEKGDKGDTGPIGPKPVNGIDYNTNAEREEFKNAVVADSKTDLEKYIAEKETQLDNYTKEKETKLDDYVTDTVKPTIDTYVTDTTKKDIDAYEKEKEKVLDTYTDTKKTEIDNYVANTSKPALDQYEKDKEAELETAKNTAISEYDAHAESVLTETNDLFNALDTEKISGNELYIEDAKPCRIMNTEIGGMYKQNQTKGLNFFDITGYTDRTVNGINIKVNDNGTLTLNGVCTVEKTFINISVPEHIIPAGTYTRYMSYAENIKSFLTLALSYNNTTISNTSVQPNNQYTTSTYNDDITYNQIKLYIPNTTVTFNNIIVDPMLVRGEYTANNAPKYEPYTGCNPSPSPDYLQAIEQVESVNFVNTRKNILPSDFIGKTITSNASLKNIKVKPGKDYYMTLSQTLTKAGTGNNPMSAQHFRKFIDKDGKVISSANFGIMTFTAVGQTLEKIVKFTIPQNCVTIELDIGTYYSNSAEIKTNYYQLEERNATKYEPYKKQTIALDLKGNKLCAASDTIKDKLLIDRNGNVALQKNVDMYSITGNENFEFRTSEGTGISQSDFSVNCKLIQTQVEDFSVLSNYFGAEKTWNNCWLKDNICIQMLRNKKIRFQTSKFATKDEAKNFFKQQYEAGNPVIIYFQAESKLIDLGQVQELPKTFNGINNVWAETNIGNTEIEIEYVQDVKKLLEKQSEQQNARLNNIEALLSTTETSALLLDNMQNDLEKEVE